MRNIKLTIEYDGTRFYGFQIQKEKRIDIPRDILEKYVSAEDVTAFLNGEIGVYSISVYAEKGIKKEAPEEIAGADFGPLGDIVDLGLAAGTILGAVFGQKHADAPAPLNFSNPTAPIGI